MIISIISPGIFREFFKEELNVFSSDIVGNFVFFGEKHPYRTDKVTQSTLKYSGTSETVTTYHRPALSMITAAHFGYYSYWFNFSNITDEFIANGLTISGGWNETDMSTQTGHTCLLYTSPSPRDRG
mgnify:CR=1 FL=1